MILVNEEPRGPSELIEIPVTANGVTRINIPDIQQLRSQQGQVIIVKGIRTITAKVLTNAPITGSVVSPIAELRKASLVLYADGWEKGHLIPLLTMVDEADADATTATTIPYRFKTTKFDDWKNVDWSKSYIQFSNGTVSATQPYWFVL